MDNTESLVTVLFMKSKKPDGTYKVVLSNKKKRVKKLTTDQYEIMRLRQALKTVGTMLQIPAAEYVPAIPEVWDVIDAALKN